MSFYVYDVVTQRPDGQHYYFEDGRVQPSPIELRYAWPAELDLMARLAGMRLEDRWGGWQGEPFTAPQPVPRVGVREDLTSEAATPVPRISAITGSEISGPILPTNSAAAIFAPMNTSSAASALLR